MKGVDVLPDTSHATPALAAHIRGCFQAKSDKNLDRQISCFSRTRFTYIAAILGRHWYAWQDMRTAPAGWYPLADRQQVLPHPAPGRHHQRHPRLHDTPGMFGPGQVRNFGGVNFGQDGRIERRVDYRDARRLGVADWQKEQEPPARWPTDFRQSTVWRTPRWIPPASTRSPPAGGILRASDFTRVSRSAYKFSPHEYRAHARSARESEQGRHGAGVDAVPTHLWTH